MYRLQRSPKWQNKRRSNSRSQGLLKVARFFLVCVWYYSYTIGEKHFLKEHLRFYEIVFIFKVLLRSTQIHEFQFFCQFLQTLKQYEKPRIYILKSIFTKPCILLSKVSIQKLFQFIRVPFKPNLFIILGNRVLIHEHVPKLQGNVGVKHVSFKNIL